jgi:hypothetical protein
VTHVFHSVRARVRRTNPLDNKREPRLGRLAVIPIAASALLIVIGLTVHMSVEQRRLKAVEAAVIAAGWKAPVEVRPIRGGECWRAREGFSWRAADAEGWACAGPGSEVRLQAPIRRTLSGTPG